jgi:hypothetical protein
MVIKINVHIILNFVEEINGNDEFNGGGDKV